MKTCIEGNISETTIFHTQRIKWTLIYWKTWENKQSNNQVLQIIYHKKIKRKIKWLHFSVNYTWFLDKHANYGSNLRFWYSSFVVEMRTIRHKVNNFNTNINFLAKIILYWLISRSHISSKKSQPNVRWISYPGSQRS